MGYIILNTDREDEMSGLRQNMRKRYGYRSYGSNSSMRGEMNMRDHYYKKGYEHAMEDMEDMEDMEMRRARDSRGRYI